MKVIYNRRLQIAKIMAEQIPVKKVTSIDEIPFEDYNEKDLIAFDFHDTIAVEDMNVMRNINSDLRSQFISEIRSKAGDTRVSYLFDNLKYQLIEDSVKSHIESLQERNVGVIYLTATRTGIPTPDCIKSVEDKYIDTLKDLSICLKNSGYGYIAFEDLHPSNPELVDHLIDPKLKSFHFTPGALVKSGVIFTNNISKGLVLGRIFKETNYFPKRFILIDDNIKNHITTYEAIQSINKEYNTKIIFVGYLYEGALNLDNKTDDIVISIQKKYLLKDDYKLLSDIEAMRTALLE